MPDTYDAAVVDRILPIEDEQAFAGMRLLASTQGLLVGISSGAAFSAALQLAREDANRGKTIVAILPDTGERYLSMNLFTP